MKQGLGTEPQEIESLERLLDQLRTSCYCSLMHCPHPFPYQGSKRSLAKRILPFFPSDVDRLIEPFCGAAAITIAASTARLAKSFLINDLNAPLMELWEMILSDPLALSDSYEKLWNDQQPDRKAFFLEKRAEFNQTKDPRLLLYLLARIVKGAVRYSSKGDFNQSADNRRDGMQPKKMREQLRGVSLLLEGKIKVRSGDYREVLRGASTNDLVYMDPPYQGTSFTRDHRYFDGLSREDFVSTLAELNERNISYLVSYDGRTGEKTFGEPLPDFLGLRHIELQAGRSSQATLLGASDETIESLYLSPSLLQRLARRGPATKPEELKWLQHELAV